MLGRMAVSMYQHPRSSRVRPSDEKKVRLGGRRRLRRANRFTSECRLTLEVRDDE